MDKKTKLIGIMSAFMKEYEIVNKSVLECIDGSKYTPEHQQRMLAGGFSQFAPIIEKTHKEVCELIYSAIDEIKKKTTGAALKMLNDGGYQTGLQNFIKGIEAEAFDIDEIIDITDRLYKGDIVACKIIDKALKNSKAEIYRVSGVTPPNAKEQCRVLEKFACGIDEHISIKYLANTGDLSAYTGEHAFTYPFWFNGAMDFINDRLNEDLEVVPYALTKSI